MRIYKTQEEVEADIVNEVLNCNDEDVTFECDINIDASIINAWNINARDINARNINARDINASDINAWDINARDINAWNINARDINARDINARDINAWNINARDINASDINARNINARDINARDIKAENISYHAFCIAYKGITCKSIKGERENHLEPQCLDGELTIKEDQKDEEMTLEEVCKELGRDIKIKK